MPMLVKAKWNVKDGNGWHKHGEVFDTESDLGEAVDVLEAPKKTADEKPENEPEKGEAKAETKAATARSSSRRRASK